MGKRIFTMVLFFTTAVSIAQELTAVQKFPDVVTEGSEYVVETTINQGTITEFMKFFQEIPAGCTATAMESKGGVFSFSDGGAKIIWLASPPDQQFMISYKVIVPKGITGVKTITGKIAYMVKNERKTTELPVRTLKIEAQTPTVSNVEKVQPVQQMSVKEETKEKPIVPATTETLKENKTNPVLPANNVPVTAIPSSSGKTFRVQIGAFSSRPSIKGVPEPSTVVLENGITKYFSGNFKTYDEAVKRKKEMIEKGYQGAFIVSFENGKIVK